VSGSALVLDPRLNAFRADLADRRIAGKVAAPRYVTGSEARVAIGRAAVLRTPDQGAAIDTYYHYGEPILVFDRDRAYAWCQSLFDGYVGYVEDRHLTGSARSTHFIATMGSFLYDEPDLRSGHTDFLPRHGAVSVSRTGFMTRSTEYVRLDTGGFLPRACLSEAPPRSPDLVAAARLYLGCPYLWAGKSFLGLDCSALVQNAFRDIGVAVLRDTDMQQHAIGVAVPVRDGQELRSGDLLYLPGHVLIYAGAGAVIHADGSRMMVREEPLAAFLERTGGDLSSFTVRRHRS
jgi:cell wall-associated NlpC family hydrolase